MKVGDLIRPTKQYGDGRFTAIITTSDNIVRGVNITVRILIPGTCPWCGEIHQFGDILYLSYYPDHLEIVEPKCEPSSST